MPRSVELGRDCLSAPGNKALEQKITGPACRSGRACCIAWDYYVAVVQIPRALMINEDTSQAELAEYAYVVGDNEDGRLPLDLIHWSYVEDFPLERLLEVMSAREWKAWFGDELGQATERGTDLEWRRLLDEDIEEPLVILDHEGLLIWDGWHRAAASVIKGVAPKAVLGVKRSLDLNLSAAAPFFRM